MEDDLEDAELERLVHLLQLAYSGELAAAHAYAGHARSVSDESEREQIRKIENEEWHHRELVGGLLAEIGREPNRWRERRALLLGRILGALCHVAGWFVPMYGAGRLERRNIVEYENAARHACRSGHEQFVECLLQMAEVEWEHEQYFRARVESHPFARLVPVWDAPPPRDEIRRSFARELA